MNFPNHFSRLADDYRRFRPGYPDALFAYLASQCPRHELAWDCGTGSGQAAVGLVRYFSRVVATDASAEQIRQAQPRHNVEYAVATESAPMLAHGSADLVTAAQAAHWFAADRFYPEVRRVLKPGGIIAVWTYVLPHAGGEIDRILLPFYRETVGPFWPPERVHVDNEYRDLPFPFPRLPEPEMEMRETWTCDQYLGFLRTWSAVSRYRQEHGEDPVALIEKDVRAAWGDPTQDRLIRWPLVLRVGRA